jgi:Cys-rich repeat protein
MTISAPRVRSFRSRLLHVAASGLSLAALVHCTSSVAEGTNGSVDGGIEDASVTDAQCASTPSQPVTRPLSCPARYDAGAGAGVACASLADCQDGGAANQGCLGGSCSLDQCLTDSDCPTGEACGCSAAFHGNGYYLNECVPAQCRTNADCGAGFACSPSNAGYCSSLAGFYCHSAADTCVADADCCPRTFPAPQCVYQPALGHFACQTGQVCSG